MTQFAKVITEGLRPPDEKEVIALLHANAIPEKGQVTVIMQAGFSSHTILLRNSQCFGT